MSFFSKTTRRQNRIKPTFKAFRTLKTLIHGASGTKFAIPVAVLLLLAGIGYQEIFAAIDDTPVVEPPTQQINVYPTLIEGEHWEGVEAIYLQDLSSYSLYQDFDSDIAGYVVPVDAEQVSSENGPEAVEGDEQDTDTEGSSSGGSTQENTSSSTDQTATATSTDNVATEETASTTVDSQLPDPEPEAPAASSTEPADSETEVIDDPVQGDDTVPAHESEQTEEVVDETDPVDPEPESEPASDPEPEPVEALEPEPEESAGAADPDESVAVFKKASETMFTFFSSVTKFLPFTNAGTSTSQVDEVPVEDPDPQDSTEPEVVPDPAEAASTTDPLPQPEEEPQVLQSETASTTEGSPEGDELLVEDVLHATTTQEAEDPEGTASTTDSGIDEDEEIATSTDSEASDSTEEDGVSEEVALVEEAEEEEYQMFCSVETAEPCGAYPIEFTGFDIPELEEGYEINNLQLRFSMAARPSADAEEVLDGNLQGVSVEYAFDDRWRSAGDVFIFDEVSNAINGGYFLHGLPTIENASELSNLRIRLTYHGNEAALEALYLDALWLEVESTDYSVLDDVLLERDLLLPVFNDFYLELTDFTADQVPEFFLRYNTQRSFFERISDAMFSEQERQFELEYGEIAHATLGPLDAELEVTYLEGDNWIVRLKDDAASKLRPGKYTVTLHIREGDEVFVDEFEFYWGVLAVNTDQTLYEAGDEAVLHMAALTDNGDTICDADLRITVIDPDNYIHDVPVEQSGLCEVNNVIDAPDYFSAFETTVAGDYQVRLSHYNTNGDVVHAVKTFFSVTDEERPFVIERSGPTRIYPLADYDVTLKVTANKAYTGLVSDYVPYGFALRGVTEGATELSHEENKSINWYASFEAGETKEFTYSFDAPDISPYLYMIGPAEVGDFTELKQWQIASDALIGIAWLEGTQLTSGTNFNVGTAAAIEWSTVDLDGAYFATTSNPEELQIQTAGDYLFGITLPLTQVNGGNNQRSRTQMEIRVNGTKINEGVGRSSFIRSNGFQQDSSNHLSVLVPNLSVSDIVEVFAFGVSDVIDSVTTPQASLYAEYISPSETVFFATSTQVTSGTNLNPVSAAELEWVEVREDVGYTHSDVSSPEDILLTNAGNYMVFVNVPLDGAITRANVKGRVLLNGIEVDGGQFNQGYIRNSDNDDNASIHWSGVVQSTTSNQTLSISLEQEGAAGTLTAGPDVATIYVQELPSSDVYFGKGTTLTTGSNDWDPNPAQEVEWTTDEIIDTSVYSHSATTSSHQVTLLEAGSYLLVYNDALTVTGGQRINPHITIEVNGSPVLGAETRSHYLRNNTSVDGSGSLTFLLENLSATDVITVSVLEGDASGTVDDLTEALLMLWKKQDVVPAGGAPTLYNDPFDNYRATTTRPSFEFSNTLTSDIQYQFSWSTSSVFLSSTTRTSGIDNGFLNTENGGDTSPFNDGERVRFTIEASDAMVDGETYWWRVRSNDVDGSNTFGDWTIAQSITINTASSDPDWFQTTNDQFLSNTLTNTTVSGGSASITTLGNPQTTTADSFEGVSDASIDFSSTALWKQAAITTDVGDWQAEANSSGNSGSTGPAGPADGSVYIFTEASNNQTCDNQGESTDCAIEADIEDGSLDGIQFDYHMWDAGSGDIGTLSLDLYNGSTWTTVWSRTGEQSVDENDWLDSGYIDLSANKATTTAMRFYNQGTGLGFQGDVALDNIRVATSTGGPAIVLTEEIEFAWNPVAGNTDWGLVSWDVTEPAGSETKLAVYYSDVGTCDTLVPDIDLPGNSTGFDDEESPLFIASLSTTTYDTLCLEMTLDNGSASTTPFLNEWSLGWAVPDQPPEAPLLDETPAFDNIKSTTTTPVLGGFSASDYEGDTMEFVLEVDDNYDFSSPELIASSSEFLTDAGWSAATFASGATTTYAIQSGDALVNGTTYYWRVKARDLLGTNTFGDYSRVRSITISTEISDTEWFQTADEQFSEALLLTNATTTGSGQVTIDDPVSRVSELDVWAEGTTFTVSTGTDRLLVVTISLEDNAGLGCTTSCYDDVDVDTVEYGGVQLTEIFDQPVGPSASNFVNGMWMGYLDEAGIASAVGNTIAMTGTVPAPSNGITYLASSYENVDQDSPIRDSSANAEVDEGTVVSPASSLNVLNGDWMLYVTESSVGLDHTAATGYTEAIETTTGGSGFDTAAAYKAITADGNENPEATWSGAANRMIIIAAGIAPESVTGSIMSSDVDFDWVEGQLDWGEITWNTTVPTGATTSLQVYYSNSGECDTLIPNGDLPGNDAGFQVSDSPLDISGLSTSTYNRICLEMTLDEGSSLTLPTLDDWEISWELSSVYRQTDYQWYVNENSITPTDTWPVGVTAEELIENEPIVSTNPVATGDVLRLRTGVEVSSVAAVSKEFKLQYAEGLVCSSGLSWNDVAPAASTTALWRGYNNASVSDGATLPSTLLSGSDVVETYEEENNSAATPNTINAGDVGEWDWVVQHNAEPGTSYCFRMVTAGGDTFKTYSNYPQLVTNQAPETPTHSMPFDNEKVASTSPWFEFIAVDPEGEELTYQIQIDDDADFSSTVIDTDTASNVFDFENLETPADKDPYNQNELMRYEISSALSNGTTYWWRVRSYDPNGANQNSEWSTSTSFTVDTSVLVSTWYQNTTEQFETNTLSGAVSATGDALVGSGVGTTTSTAIDFDNGTVGNAWGQFSFSETGGAGDILHHIEYFDGDSWELVPDVDLSGNATGFDASPVSIIDLDTEVYNQIRIRSNFVSGTPTVVNWSIEWGERVSVPTLVSLFDNAKADTTTPTFTFFTTDPEDDSLEYQISWSTDNTFSSGTTTHTSDVAAGWLDLTSGGGNPYDSGNLIQYTVQPGDALTSSSTYWWRVRARDPLGGNAFSFWSDPYSFTVDESIQASTWFQTTDEQFETNTLPGLETTGSGGVTVRAASVNTYNFNGVTNPGTDHIALEFEVDVDDPTDPPINNDIASLTTDGTNTGTPNLRSALRDRANQAEASTAEYTALGASDDSRWTTLDPGANDNSVFWVEMTITEDAADINQIDITLEGYQGAAADTAWLGVWHPGTTTPFWEYVDDAQATTDTTYTGSITSNFDEYLDGDNKIHLIFLNEDTASTLSIDYVEVEVSSSASEDGVLTGTGVDFDDGGGPAWEQAYWTDTIPVADTLTYQVQYLDPTDVWTLVPDSEIPGNSVGTTTAPINLKQLDTSVYNELRLVANFDCVGVSCPTVDDWTIEWAEGIDIIGTSYGYDQTSSTTGDTLAVAVNGVLQVGKTATVVNGDWQIDNVNLFAGDVVTVFRDGAAAADRAVAVSRYDGSPEMYGVELYSRHLTIGSDDLVTISNADLEQYDATDDPGDIFFDVTSGALDMCVTTNCGDATLVVLPDNTYQMLSGESSDIHDIEVDGTLITAGNTLRVSGSWDNNATTTLTGSTVVFTATSTTETIDLTGASVSNFINVTFGETLGTATWTLVSPLDIDGDLTVEYGTLDRSSLELSIVDELTIGANGFFSGIGTTTFDGSDVSTWVDNNAVQQNIGDVVVDGTAHILLLGSDVLANSVSIAAANTLDLSSNGYTLAVQEDWTNNGVFQARNSEVDFVATSTGFVIAAGGADFFDLTFSGVGGSWSFTEAELAVGGDYEIATGTVTFPTGTTTIGGSFTNATGTFVHNNSVVIFDSSGAETITQNGTPFLNAFYDVVFDGFGSWAWTDTNATTSNDFTIEAGAVTLPSGVLSMSGDFEVNGGSFTHNSGEVVLVTESPLSVTAGGSSFNDLTITSSGAIARTFADTNTVIEGDLTITTAQAVFPTGTLSIGGSFLNDGTFNANGGTVLFNSVSGSETIASDPSVFATLEFNSVTGDWTVTDNIAASVSASLTNASAFTVDPGISFGAFGTFTNSVGGASTTWTGSTLLLTGNNEYSLNTKDGNGDVYGTVQVTLDTDVSMWNSSAAVYSPLGTGSIYSQDHAGVDGDLYIYGDYDRNTGTEYWSYATDFDGTVLTATTSRSVQVRLANGAVVSVDTAIWDIQGDAAASTTVAAQSGTYTLLAQTATVTASHFLVSGGDTDGFQLTASTTVSSFDNAEFTIGTGNSAVTVDATTIDTNPTAQYFNTDFVTGGGSTNVTLLGVPTSYWWFRDGAGDRYGEAFDNDDGDAGVITWDDSSYNITVGGTVYADDGTTPLGGPTCDGVTNNVRIVVDGSTTFDGTCSAADGSYSIPGVAYIGDPVITAYLNTNGGVYGSVITKTPTTDITDLDIYANRVITRHENVAPLTIADMAIFDSSDDTDLRFIAATSTTDSLSTFAQTELFVWASTTFTPEGTVVLQADVSANVYDGTLQLGTGATFVAVGTTTYEIGGSLIQGDGATIEAASSTLLFTATTTGKALTANTGETIDLYNVRFTGVSGGWNINADLDLDADLEVATGTVTGTGDITLNNGAFFGDGLVSLGGGVTTLATTNTLGGVQGWTFNDLTLGTGAVTGTTTLASSATTTVAGVLTIGTGHFFDAGSAVINLSGDGTVFVENGTFVQNTSTVLYSGVAATDILTTNYYNLRVDAAGGTPVFQTTGIGILVENNLSVGGTAPTTLDLNTVDTILTVQGDVAIAANGTIDASATSLLTVEGSWDNDGTFTANTGSVLFNGAGTHTIAAGGSSFGTLTVSGVGDFTVTEHATATGNMLIATSSSFTVSSSQSLAVGGTFTNALGGAATTWTGSTLSLFGGGNYTVNDKALSDNFDTLLVAAGTQVRLWNSVATTTVVSATGGLYSQDHAGVDGDLYIYGDYVQETATDFWSYATDFDGTDLTGVERTASVYVEGGGSVTYQTAGALAMVGVSTASTTVENQGAGVYSFDIGNGASTTMNYYTLQDIDSDGLSFSGSPDVHSLSYGSLLVANNGDSAMTVAGTVLTANPGLNITDVSFATSSGVTTATNVTATGASISSWRFTNHDGDIDGELFDDDPDGDPGYIVWDDSVASVTISGNVYSDEGTTVSAVCDGTPGVIRVRVAGITDYFSDCAAGTGFYSVTGVAFSPTDSVVAYIDGEAVVGAAVTADLVSNISNMDIYEDRVIVRHESGDPLSIVDMAAWDSSDDADIPFTAVDAGADTLTLPADTKLIVWDSKEFEPVGNVTISGGGAGTALDGTLELQDDAIFTAADTETHSVGGSLIAGSGAVFDAAESSMIFTSSVAGRTIDINNDNLHTATFSGTGDWSITDAAIAFTGDVIIGNTGDITFPSGTTTFSGAFTNPGGGTFDPSTGLMIFDAATGPHDVEFDNNDVHTLIFNGAGSWEMQDLSATSTDSVTITSGSVTLPSGTFSIAEDFINKGTVLHNDGELRLYGTGGGNVLTTGGDDLHSVTIDAGAGDYVLTEVSATFAGSLEIDSGTFTVGTGTLAIGDSFDATGGTFVHSSGTVLFNSTAGAETVDPGANDFYNVVFGSGSGNWTITGNATATNNFTLSAASSFTMQSGETLYVGNVFDNAVGGAATTWTGSTLILNGGVEYTLNTKASAGDQYDNLQITSNTDLSMWNSGATTVVTDTGASLYSMDNDGTDGELAIYGDYEISTTTEYWSYATDFDGASLSGSERQVNVQIASGATTTLSGSGVLNIVGESGGETIIENQGAGTYAFKVTGGTFNALYYSYADLDADGLHFTDTPAILSLTEGDFELAVDGGTTVTVASTTLNANASLLITGASFSTTTAITGFNVTLLGSTSNAWTFTGHTGNLDGENYDVDTGALCGSLRWLDSSCLLTQQTHYRWRNDDGGAGVPDLEWFDASWDKRKGIRIQNADATTYIDAAVQIFVEYDSDMQSDFDDLRFTDANGTTTLPHFIASTTNSTAAEVWVKLPTLTAEASENIQMYYGNAAATSSASSTLVFDYADDFEDGDIAEYTEDTSLFTVDGTFAYGGSFGLDNTGEESERATDGIFDLSASVVPGKIIRYAQYVDTGAGSGDEVCTLFAVQGDGTSNQNYAVCLEQFGVDRMSLAEDVKDADSSGTILSSTTVSYSTGWYIVEIDWQSGGAMDVTLSQNGTVVATTSASDTTHTSGAVGYTYWFHNGGWDNFTVRPRVDTEPTITFGGEQVDGGASWAEEVDAVATSFTPGDIARLRLLIDNTGLQITDQTYQLEYALQGASPSCEAVDGGDYTAVPNQASCGTSPLCMADSVNITDGDAIADLLTLSDGDFTDGEITEDPNNTADALTLEQDEYTELEYVITPTSNVTDPNLCLRATNVGAELDTYLQVAKMQLRFDPSLDTVSFNNGQDISLLPGTTTRIYATSTVTDLNGYADVVSATSTMYKTDAGAACTADNNNCYIESHNTQCSFNACSGNSCELQCYADFYYHAEPSDTDGTDWVAFLEVEDTAGGYGFASSPGVELYTLRALGVTEVIDYGAIGPDSDTGGTNATTTIENQGNSAIDVQIVGDDLEDGLTSVIPASQQIFATSSFNYSACLICTTLATTSVDYEVDLAKPVTNSPPVTDDLYWGIAVPYGVPANPHTGNNTFYAIDDS